MAPNMALQRTRRPRYRSGRSRCSLGSPLSLWSLGGNGTVPRIVALVLLSGVVATGLLGAERRWRPLEFRLVEPVAGRGLIAAEVQGQENPVFLHPRTELDDRDLAGADARKGQYGESIVSVRLTRKGLRKMRAVCKKHQGATLAIVVNGAVVATPVIDGALSTDVLQITGALSEEEAKRLVRLLSAK